MYSTPVNYYIPRQSVVLYSGSSPRRYQTVYAKNLKLHKGVDNRLQFQFLNQEQKPIDITGKVITCRILGYDGITILLQKSLDLLLPVTGLASLTVTDGELSAIDAQMCYYSLTIPTDSFEYPVFVDDTSGARGVMEIVNSILPKHVPSVTIDIPTHPAPNNTSVTYNSSRYNTVDKSSLTIQTYYTDYTGNIQVQGSTSGDSDWYNVTDKVSYSTETGTDYYTIQGIHPFIRLKFISTAGTIDNILVR